jgi:hypothetical protein
MKDEPIAKDLEPSESENNKASYSQRSAGPLFLYCGLFFGLMSTGIALYRYGLPQNLETVHWLALALLFSALATSLRETHSKLALGLLSLAFSWNLHFPVTSAVFQDVRGGRRGLGIYPCLRFGHDGPNTHLIEKILGPRPADWRWLCPISSYGSWIRDGNERVNSRSLIRAEDFAEILSMLPTDRVRKQVTACLCDPENRLRVHQGMLLRCLKELGFPKDYDAGRWWASHSWIFFRCDDPVLAAFVTEGWLDAVDGLYENVPYGHPDFDRFTKIADQRRAAAYQESGAWGGDGDFAQGRMILAEEPAARPSLKRGAIVWWPERQPSSKK